mmetsp:Transcript_26057/g.61441  ORF Transcript_26057/g.61441 Transcript_26057/m.61441 type:complete len:82 (-) Transcript_26057:4-249(-)
MAEREDAQLRQLHRANVDQHFARVSTALDHQIGAMPNPSPVAASVRALPETTPSLAPSASGTATSTTTHTHKAAAEPEQWF